MKKELDVLECIYETLSNELEMSIDQDIVNSILNTVTNIIKLNYHNVEYTIRLKKSLSYKGIKNLIKGLEENMSTFIELYEKGCIFDTEDGDSTLLYNMIIIKNANI